MKWLKKYRVVSITNPIIGKDGIKQYDTWIAEATKVEIYDRAVVLRLNRKIVFVAPIDKVVIELDKS